MAKVEAPNKGYNGPGPGGAVFVDGHAETDDDAALNYYRGAGYRVSGKVDNPVEFPEPPDPRELTEDALGTRLRDAAVDPHPEDFLPPINAGEGNPHGSTVVAPEIHASGPAGVRPGEVYVDNLGKQEAREKGYAEARLIDNAAAWDAVKAEVDVADRGPLDLSDPGSADMGRVAASDGDPGDTGEAPAKSASKGEWVDFAVESGADRGEAEDSTKPELVDKYGN